MKYSVVEGTFAAVVCNNILQSPRENLCIQKTVKTTLHARYILIWNASGTHIPNRLLRVENCAHILAMLVKTKCFRFFSVIVMFIC
jgi:hypothetical protein